MDSNWKWNDDPHLGCISLRQIMSGEKPVLLVTHDADDGSWQFLSGDTPNEEDAVVGHLHHFIEQDPTLDELRDLPLGSLAWRERVGGAWVREMKPIGEGGV